MVPMVQGNLLGLTLGDLEIASETGLLAVFPALAISFTSYARHFVNRWTTSAFFGLCIFLADAAVHRSRYAGQYTEAALIGIGALVFSIAISYTPIGKYIDRLAEAFLERRHAD